MNIAIIFAGGVGSRMNSKSKPKQFLELHGKPIIIYTLEVFDLHDEIDGVIVSCVAEWVPFLASLVEKFGIRKVKKIISGGKTGQESIYKGLLVADELYPANSIVLIHDGVRPLIDNDLISKNIKTVNQYGSSVTIVPEKETLLLINTNKTIDKIPDRSSIAIAKAPQCFFLSDILSVHRKAIGEGLNNFIDSCSMMIYYGKKVMTIEGETSNIKITNPIDFYLFRAIVDAKENSQIFGL